MALFMNLMNINDTFLNIFKIQVCVAKQLKRNSTKKITLKNEATLLGTYFLTNFINTLVKFAVSKNR